MSNELERELKLKSLCSRELLSSSLRVVFEKKRMRKDCVLRELVSYPTATQLPFFSRDATELLPQSRDKDEAAAAVVVAAVNCGLCDKDTTCAVMVS